MHTEDQLKNVNFLTTSVCGAVLRDPAETQAELFSPIITRGHSVIAFCYFATHFRALKSFLKDSTCIKYKDFSDIATGFIADK